jgi:tetratricopeptide (TPR) repeat protein
MWRKPGEGPCEDPDCPIGRPDAARETNLSLELARANLQRMRGNYAAARDACLSILKRFPGDLPAHTLLGDIAAETGDLEQAAQWYEMALDVAPDSKVDRQRLEAIRSRIREHDAATTARQLGLPTTKPMALRFAVGTSAFIVAVAVGAYYFGGWTRARADAPVVVRDRIVLPAGAPEAKQPPQAPAAEAPQAPEPKIEAQPQPQAPPVGGDAAVLDRVRSQCVHGEAVASAALDPRHDALTLTVRAVDAAGARQVAAELAVSALRVMPEIALVTVRVAVGEQVVFVADATQAERAVAEQGGQPVPDPSALLRNEWSTAAGDR